MSTHNSFRILPTKTKREFNKMFNNTFLSLETTLGYMGLKINGPIAMKYAVFDIVLY